FALTGSLVLSLTVVPVLASFFLRGPVAEHETVLLRWARRLYEPLLDRVIAHPKATLAAGAGVLATALAVTPFLGSEFVPRMDEGDITIQAWRPASIPLGEAPRPTLPDERLLKRLPQGTTV